MRLSCWGQLADAKTVSSLSSSGAALKSCIGRSRDRGLSQFAPLPRQIVRNQMRQRFLSLPASSRSPLAEVARPSGLISSAQFLTSFSSKYATVGFSLCETVTMKQQSHMISNADEAILRALSRFHYLTATQVSRLIYPNLSDENRYAQRRLKHLVDGKYLLRLRALPAPRYGQAPHVFTLATRGRQYVAALGVRVPQSFRPSEGSGG